jgi:hypothetical protein
MLTRPPQGSRKLLGDASASAQAYSASTGGSSQAYSAASASSQGSGPGLITR